MAISVTGLTAWNQDGSGTWVDWGGGAGSSQTTVAYLSSTASRGRKFSGAKGMGYQVNAAGQNLSNSIIVVRILCNGGFAATLAGGGCSIRLQDTSGNQSDWYVAGSDTYKAGWIELVIDTANAESANSGTAASLTAIQYAGAYVNASGGSGGDPNFYIDEVLSLPNTGLTLGGNTSQLFSELYAWDAASLYGVVSNRAGVIFSKAPLVLSPDASDHVSTDEILIFEEPVYHDGTSVDSALTLQGLSSADSDTNTLTRLTAVCELNSSVAGTNADKKLDFGSATGIVADTCTFRGFDGSTVALGNSSNSYTGCTFQTCSQITDTGAVVRAGFVRDSQCASTEAALLWTTSSDWEDTEFVMGASNSHAIEIETNITDTWTGFTFSGYGTTTPPSSVGDEVLINNATGGVVTINASGITGTVSYRNNGTSTTTINNNVTVTFSGLVANSEVRIYNHSTGAELDGVENSGTSFAASVAGSTVVDYVIHNIDYEYIRVENFTWPSTAQTIPIQQRIDRNYANP